MPPHPGKEAHVDEAGLHGGSPIVVVSVFVVEDANAVRAAIRDVRDRHHFGNEMKSTKWSALRERVYLDVLEEIMHHEVSAQVLIGHKEDALRGLGLPKRVLGDYFTEQAIVGTADLLRDGALYLDQNPGRERNALLRRLVDCLPDVTTIEEIDSRQQDLMQVSDLICGTVYGVEMGNQRKQKLFDIIASKLVIRRWSPGTEKSKPPARLSSQQREEPGR